MTTGYLGTGKPKQDRPTQTLNSCRRKGRHGKFFTLLGHELDCLETVFLKHFPEKGTSWRRMSLNALRKRITEELAEYDKTNDYANMLKELADVGLYVLFLMNCVRRLGRTETGEYINDDTPLEL